MENLPEQIVLVTPRDRFRFLITYMNRETYERHYEFYGDEKIAQEQALAKAPTYDDIMFYNLQKTVEVVPEIRDAIFLDTIAL